MVKLGILNTLADLEQEMARSGRVSEQRALHAVLSALATPAGGYMTTGEAAARLRVSIPTVKRWVQQRGALEGVNVGTRWLVSRPSVDQLCRLRSSLRDLDDEGNPSPDQLQELVRQRRDPASARP